MMMGKLLFALAFPLIVLTALIILLLSPVWLPVAFVASLLLLPFTPAWVRRKYGDVGKKELMPK